MKEIPLIEGLRGYLALWVVIDHAMGCCGYGLNGLRGLLFILRSGWYAVDLFIIISGFVVFYLLDNKQEKYKQFITRRFFRIWPLFICLFFISIPLSKLYAWNTNEFNLLFQNSIIGDGLVIQKINTWWDNIWMHIIIHIPMLHGLFPNDILFDSPGAFLGPAWSISLEWQFYLIAPLFYIIIKKYKLVGFLSVFLICVFLFLWGINIKNIQFGAFLPMHIEFFFIGIVSYYLYKYLIFSKKKVEYSFVFSLPITLSLFYFLNFEIKYLPYFIWINFFCLLIAFANNDNVAIKILGSTFNNNFSRFIGKISYSIYLSHFLILIVIQYIIIISLPSLSQKNHFLLLVLLTLFAAIVLSSVLYKYIELYFIKKGNEISKRFRFH